MHRPNFILFLLVFLLTFSAAAGGVDKGYEALAQYDYFKAKKYFTKALKYNESAGAQGLAIIYYRDDNPFHSFDSAYVYILRSIETFDMVKERKKEKYKTYGFTKDSLYALRQSISTAYYEEAMDAPSVAGLTTFINAHPWAMERPEAIDTRDSLAFFMAVKENTSSSYKAFIETYPDSKYRVLANDNFFDVQYLEMTQDGSLESYEDFIKSNPSSPLLPKAEEQVFELVTKPTDPNSFEAFIEKYPENQFVETAWRSWSNGRSRRAGSILKAMGSRP